jgi:hypothetical protein
MGVVSKRTIAEKRGYDFDVESQRMAEEKPEFDAGEVAGPGGLPADSPLLLSTD